MKKLSRRSMLRISGSTAAGALLAAAGCAPAEKPAAPTLAETSPSDVRSPTVAPTTAPAATNTPEAPAASPTPPNPQKAYRRPEIIKFFPAQKSRVVRTRSADVWDGDKLVPAAVRKMVDSSILQLTGLKDVKEAWRALFNPEEKIAIKVNAFRNSTIWTHPELVQAVTDSLQEAGIPGEKITIFDFYDDELKTAGFTLNKDGPGVRCYGTESQYATKWNIGGTKTVKLSDILWNADALINMPVLKSHMIAGVTFALKNHYGSVSYPDGLHYMQTSLPGLNNLPPIKDGTRLVVGDVLTANLQYSGGWPYWEPDYKGDSILMSFDPLAHDMVGYQMLLKLNEEKGNDTKYIVGMADPWFKTCGETGLGANDMKDIELVEA